MKMLKSTYPKENEFRQLKKGLIHGQGLMIWIQK